MGNSGTVSFEMELVLATIATSILVIIFYLNVRQLIDRTYDVKRLNDTVAIAEAISISTIEKGHVPAEISTTEKEIKTIDGSCKNSCNNLGCINLLSSILPHLEINNLSSLEGYSVQLGKSGMITVRSCLSKSGKIIEVTR